MAEVNRRPILRLMPAVSALAVASLAAALTIGAAGCALPALSIIPPVLSLLHEVTTMKSGGESEADASKAQPEPPVAEASSPQQKLTAGNLCQMIAIARSDMVVVELRKSLAGAPEYRELRLVNSVEDARWTPIVDSDTGPDGWRPAVNFLKMDFEPPLTDAIPDNGSCYLAYAPTAIDAGDPNQAAALRSVSAGATEAGPTGSIGAAGATATTGATGAFSWAGRVYQYTVARTLPCMSPSS